MKSKRLVFLLLLIAATPLFARTRNLPAGSASGGVPSPDEQLRSMSHAIARTRVPTTIFGCGTATIDGVLDPAEWSGAGTETITVSTPAGPVTGTVYLMNDNLNLYMALKYPETVANYGSFGVEFDNDNNGVALEESDDALVANNQLGFFDDYRTLLPPCTLSSPCGPADTDGGGTKNGEMAYHNDGAYSVYEMSHELNSGDTGHDFALTEGQVVGFFVEITIEGPAGEYSTFYPDFGVYDRYIVSGCVPLASGCGTPTLDGIIGSGEWASSGEYRLSVRTAHHGTAPATMHIMNDSLNLYMALSYDQPVLQDSSLAITFDVNDDRDFTAGDDAIAYNPIGFYDLVYIPCAPGLVGCADYDTLQGGTSDGAGARGHSGSVTAFELSHPLNSGDVDDFALSWAYPDDVIGYSFFLRMIAPGGVYPDDFGDTQSVFKYLHICIPAPISAVADLNRGVNGLASTGALSTQDADVLRKDLSKASENLAAKKTKQAANDLGNFVMDVKKMIRKGDLKDRQAQPLINAANVAISQL